MKQIFYEDRRIVFISQKKQIKTANNQDIWEYTDMLDLLKRFKVFMKSPQGFTLYVRCATQASDLFKNFVQCFEILKAGGGIVQNQEGKYLYIYRYNQWDLPKGKKEKGEKLPQSALREVEEETAVSSLQIIRNLPTTYHFLSKKNQMAVKKCYWYEMTTDCTTCPLPQIEENITKALWLTREEVLEKRSEMFASIAYLSEMYFLGDKKGK